MRTRTRLESGINTVDIISRELDENVELLELGEAEGADDVVVEAVSALNELADEHITKIKWFKNH